MTDENVDPKLTSFVRNVMDGTREIAKDQEGSDVVDRILTAATLVFAALSIVWPKGRGIPTIGSIVLSIGQQIWRRRSWWLPL